MSTTPELRRYRAEANRADAAWMAGYRAGVAETKRRYRRSPAYRAAYAALDHWRFLVGLAGVIAVAVAMASFGLVVAFAIVGVVWIYAAVLWAKELRSRF